jgi:hypothetical protein
VQWDTDGGLEMGFRRVSERGQFGCSVERAVGAGSERMWEMTRQILQEHRQEITVTHFKMEAIHWREETI